MTSDDERIAYLAGDGPGGMSDTERGDLDDLRSMLSDPALWIEPDEGLEDAVVSAIAAEAVASASRAPAATGPTPTRRSRWIRPGYLVGAAAAAAAIVVAAAAVDWDQGTPSESLAAELAPTALAPGASGHATLTRTDSGWRIELDATGLPRLDDGRFYQAWLESDNEVLVTLGTFNEGNDVVLWAGVSPVSHPRFTITEESADGNAASSERVVLVGPVTGP